MKRKFRLTHSTDYLRVRRLGKSYAHPLVVMLVLPFEQGDLKIGVSAGKSIGGAVERNRAKRLIRAALQPMIVSLKRGYHCIVLARQPINQASFQQVQSALTDLIRRAGLYEGT